MNKKNLPRLAGVAAAAFVAAFTFGPALHALTNVFTPTILNLPVDYPQVWFNGSISSQINYNATTKFLTLDAKSTVLVGQDGVAFGQDTTVVPMRFGGILAAGATAYSFGTFTLRGKVDNNGKLIDGVAPGSGMDACGDDHGDDFCVIGEVDSFTLNSDNTIATKTVLFGPGILLRGEVVNFATDNDHPATDTFYCPWEVACDNFVFRVKLTGGDLFVSPTTGVQTGYFPTGFLAVWDQSPTTAHYTDLLLPKVPFDGTFTHDFGVIAHGDAGGTVDDANCANCLPPDTEPPQIVYDADGYEAPATGPLGAIVNLPVTVTDDNPGAILTCNPASGSMFPIGTTQVTCNATDAVGHAAIPAVFPVTVSVAPPSLPGGACFIVDFREVTYFKDQGVITTWPYNRAGGPGTTKSRGTKYRIYGFNPSEIGKTVPNADYPWIVYTVTNDAELKVPYVDLLGSARVALCANQLAPYVLLGNKGNGHLDGSVLLPTPLKNVPGILLTHNTQLVKVPTHIRNEMKLLGLTGIDPKDPRGLIDYIGVQHQGYGDARFREFIDVRVEFLGDSATDRVQHYKFGFHTALNVNFESFAGCNYVDYAPGNDGVRLRDVWGPNRSRYQGYASWQPCGSREPAVNQRQRENYEVPFNGVQILSTVNMGADTLSLFYGEIRPIPAKEKLKKDHKLDWGEWDRWDR